MTLKYQCLQSILLRVFGQFFSCKNVSNLVPFTTFQFNRKAIVIFIADRKHKCDKQKYLILPAGTFLSGHFFYQKSTKAAIEANNGTYCLRKRIEKFPLISFWRKYVSLFTSIAINVVPVVNFR